jgi:DNA helicase II / ATP-dependent DNA helicase PcrA
MIESENNSEKAQISQDAVEVIEVEVETLNGVVGSLEVQIQEAFQKLQSENERARELTSGLVNTRRAEDKVQLASDEAVSHALKDNKQKELQGLRKLIDKPYFARIIVEEEVNGDIKQLEYKIGFETNLACRIIDWRKAPLSRLYYQYKEGDFYDEDIQGRERSGTVLLRNRVAIEKGELVRVGCRLGEFTKIGSNWKTTKSGARSSGSYNQLPDVFSLITPEQFSAITENASSAVLIQGIAGSGKTTVALHRLSWLLDKDNSDVSSLETAVLVMSPALKVYITNSLPALQAEEVKVFDFDEWVFFSLTGSTLPKDMSLESCPSTVNRIKHSLAFLSVFEEVVSKFASSFVASETLSFEDLRNFALELIVKTSEQNQEIISRDKTKLIDKSSIELTLKRSKGNFSNKCLDSCDLPLLLRLRQILFKDIYLPSSDYGLYKHLVIDEVQDLSPSHLRCILSAVESVDRLTLVGDTAQNIHDSSLFPGWDALMELANLDEENSKFLQLEVSFRSTLPIMKLAEYVVGKNSVETGRSGRTPIWFDCFDEEKAVESSIDWLSRALEKYPTAITAVLCKTSEEAKLVYSYLLPTFGTTIRLADKKFFSLDEGIIVCEVSQVKGLEFCNILLWNVSKSNYNRNKPKDKNLLYVAITRAEENVSLITWKAHSELLPPHSSSLVRHIQIEQEIVEAVETANKDESRYYEG